jgi:hypothetical protein
MKPRLLAAAGALALALVTASCSTVQSDAARVDGTSISVADFEDQLQSFTDDPLFLPSRPITNPETGELENDFVRQVLFINTLGAFARSQNEAAGVTPPTDDEFTQTVRTQSAGIMGFDPGSGQWATVAEENRQPVEDEIAQILTLFSTYGEQADDPALVREYYDLDPAQFSLLCARHILVGTEAEARDVIERIEAGEDFAAVAGELSTDTGSGANGGLLYEEGGTCPPANGFVTEFVDGALATPVGEVSEPVQSEFGWHVIIPHEVVERPFEEVQADVAEAMRAGASRRAITDFGASDVWINPRFGVWDQEAGFIDAPVPGPSAG